MKRCCKILLLLEIAGVFAATSTAQTLDSRQDKVQPPPASPKNISLREALAKLQEAYQVYFLYEDSLIRGKMAQPLPSASRNLYYDLDQLLRNNGLAYEKVGAKIIVLTPKRSSPPKAGAIKGKVTTENSEGISSVLLLDANPILGAAANADGEYIIANVPAGTYTLRSRMIGYRPQDVAVTVNAGETVTQNFSLTPDVLNMREIVVTGTRNPQAKIESSVAITTANAAQIAERTPRNTADLLKVIPGFYVESSGGEGGNNLFARGIPADGSFRHVAMHEDGLPVFESPELAFANIDELMRVDESVEVMEAVRGSTGSIFASNAPAGIINFISKTGGVTPAGVIKATIGDYGLFRTDVNWGGPLGKKWRFNVGGFYRLDRGIRNPSFDANKGGQIKANVTRLLKNGYVRAYGKFLDDRNVFYLPIPLQNPHAPQGIPGFDPNHGTLATADAAFIKVPAPNGRAYEFDLRNGVHPKLKSVGAEIFLKLGDGWTLKNSTRAMRAELEVNAIFSIFNPTTAINFARGKMESIPGAAGFRYRFTHFPDVAFEPAAANGNGLVVESGWWAANKPLRNFTNHLQLTKQLANHALTGGLYFSDYSADDFWYWQNILLEVRDHPRTLDLVLTDANGNDLVSVTKEGFTQFGTVYVNARNNGLVAAYYLNDEWKATEALRLDGGFRYEHNTLSGTRENHGVFDLGDTTTLADDEAIFGDGTFRPYDFSYNEWALSIGGNYRVRPDLSFYARGSKGFRMPDFDQFRAVSPSEDLTLEKGEVEEFLQFEGGIKISSSRFALFGAVFLARLNNLPFNDEVVDPATGDIKTARRFANSTAIGTELEAVYSSVKGLEVDLIVTLQNPRLRDFSFTIDGKAMNFDGNRVRRIPQVVVDFRPSYKFANFKIYGNLRYVGERFVDDANEVTLPDYVEFHAGAFYQFPRVALTLNAANLTNAIGLTEGNPRVGQVVGVKQDLYMARPILGRSVTLSVAYSF